MNRRDALLTLATGSAVGALAGGVAIMAMPPAAAAPASSIKDMVVQLHALFTRTGRDNETDQEAEAHCEAFSALQTCIIRAEPQTPRDVALQFLADTFFGDTDNSDEFRDRLLAMGAIGGAA